MHKNEVITNIYLVWSKYDGQTKQARSFNKSMTADSNQSNIKSKTCGKTVMSMTKSKKNLLIKWECVLLVDMLMGFRSSPKR